MEQEGINVHTMDFERKTNTSDCWIGCPLQWRGEFIYMSVPTSLSVDAISTE